MEQRQEQSSKPATAPVDWANRVYERQRSAVPEVVEGLRRRQEAASSRSAVLVQASGLQGLSNRVYNGFVIHLL